MQQEIDHLKRKLCHEQRRRTPFISDFSSDDKEDGSYRQRLRTPPSESFSYVKDYHHEHRHKSSSSKGLGNVRWAERSNKFLNRLSHVGLRKGDFLSGSHSPHSPCTMAEQTPWNIWDTLTRGWQCILRMRL